MLQNSKLSRKSSMIGKKFVSVCHWVSVFFWVQFLWKVNDYQKRIVIKKSVTGSINCTFFHSSMISFMFLKRERSYDCTVLLYQNTNHDKHMWESAYFWKLVLVICLHISNITFEHSHIVLLGSPSSTHNVRWQQWIDKPFSIALNPLEITVHWPRP